MSNAQAQLDIKDVAARAIPHLEAICAHWLPDGKRQGHDWVALNPTRDDQTPGSFSVSLLTGGCIDHATGDQCHDIVSTVRYLDGLQNQVEAARKVAEFLGTAPLPDPAQTPTPTKSAPKAMKARPTAHPKLGKPSAQWDYLDADKRLLCAVLRFETPDGKEFRPITQTPDGWIWKAPSEPRPLYGLDRLAARPDAPVILAEGEKAADAAAVLLPDGVHIASMNGAKSPKRSDWSPLQGRRVLIWPDADEPGAQFAQTAAALASKAGARRIEILDLSSLADDLPPGWDAADALADGWTPERFAECARFAEWSTPAEPATDASEADVSRLKHCDLSNLRNADLAAPEFVVEPLIPRGHLTLFGGHGGCGKSSAALAMGAHVACGRAWGGFTVTQGRVLLVSYEDAEELVLWRLKKIAMEYQLPLSALMANMTIIDATEAEAMMIEVNDHGVRRLFPSEDGDQLFQMIEAGMFDLVIVDNASDCFGGNENDRQQVRHFVRRCASAVKGHKGAVLLLAHIDKNAARFGSGKNSYSGSTAWHNSARSRLALIEDELRQEKLNVGKAHPDPVLLEWKGPVPVPSAQSGAELARAMAAEVDDAAIVECFRSAEATGETVPAASTGPATFVHILTNYPECPASLKADKTRVKESVARLMLKKIIRREEYKNADRKPKTRLVLADDCKHGVAPMCANVELEQIGANRRTLCAAPMRIGGVGDWSSAENGGIGTGALAHAESPVFCADDIGGIVEGEV
ncbi:MAG: AAA family ATPase [Chromatiales bacterium]|nr:AAA family ATPase [Chromatiales bacterium]